MAAALTRRNVVAVVGGAVGAALLVAAPAGAHQLPGGGALDGLAHPVLGIDHLLAMVAVGVLAALSSDRRVAWAVPAGFVGGMVLGGALGIAGVPAPGVEVAIAGSVVALGVLVVTGAAGGSVALVAVAAVMGALHGQAHGAELPHGAAPVAYVAGFVVATAALHAAGAGIGIALRRAPAVRAGAGALISAAGVLLLVGAGA